MPRVDKGDLIAGLLIIAVGMFFLFGAMQYRMGTIVRMGPGMLPLYLSMIAIGLGAIITLLAFGRSGTVPRPSLRAMAAVLGAIATFGLLVGRTGLLPAVFLAVLVASLADRESALATRLIAAAVVAGVCTLVFVGLLGLQMRAFRMPF